MNQPSSLETLALTAVKAHADHTLLMLGNDRSPERQRSYTAQLAALKSLYDTYEAANQDKSPAELRSELNVLLTETARSHLVPHPPEFDSYYPIFTVEKAQLEAKVSAATDIGITKE